MTAEYEYTVVELPDTPYKQREADWTALVNRVAEHGWRLTNVARGSRSLDRDYAFFERRAGGGGHG